MGDTDKPVLDRVLPKVAPLVLEQIAENERTMEVWGKIERWRESRLARGGHTFLAECELVAWDIISRSMDIEIFGLVKAMVLDGDTNLREVAKEVKIRGTNVTEDLVTKSSEYTTPTTRSTGGGIVDLVGDGKKAPTKEGGVGSSTVPVPLAVGRKEATSQDGEKGKTKVSFKEDHDVGERLTFGGDKAKEVMPVYRAGAQDPRRHPVGTTTTTTVTAQVGAPNPSESPIVPPLCSENLKDGPELSFQMSLLVTRPRALIVVADCPFPFKDQADFNALDHVVSRTLMGKPKFVRSGIITVGYCDMDNLDAMVVHCDEIPIIIMSMDLLRFPKNRTTEGVRHVNNIMAMLEGPFFFASTSDVNSPGRREGREFIFTLDGLRYLVNADTEVAVHRRSRNLWWLEIRGFAVMAFDGYGRKLGTLTPDELVKAKAVVYTESVFGWDDEKDYVGVDELLRDEKLFPDELLADPFVVAPGDHLVIIDQVRASIMTKDLMWSFVYHYEPPGDDVEDREEEVEEPKPKRTRIDWTAGQLTIEKAARMACRVLGRDEDNIEKEEYNSVLQQLFEAVPGVEVVRPQRKDKPLPKAQGTRGGRGRGNSAGVNTRSSARGGRGGAAPRSYK